MTEAAHNPALLRTFFYPVDLDRKLIVSRPFRLERDSARAGYSLSLRGAHLLSTPVYRGYKVVTEAEYHKAKSGNPEGRNRYYVDEDDWPLHSSRIWWSVYDSYTGNKINFKPGETGGWRFGSQAMAQRAAGKLNRELEREGNPSKPPAEMTAGEINRALDRIDALDSRLTDEFIAAGRGYERASEILSKSDPLARRYQELSRSRSALRNEIERRYGPGAPSRLPKSFGPIKRFGNPAPKPGHVKIELYQGIKYVVRWTTHAGDSRSSWPNTYRKQEADVEAKLVAQHLGLKYEGVDYYRSGNPAAPGALVTRHVYGVTRRAVA